MTRDDITAVLINELGRIAPEIDGTALDPDGDTLSAPHMTRTGQTPR
jgi:hypothetical protein